MMTLSIRLSIVVENYLKKINKKDLTNSNQCGLSNLFQDTKKVSTKILLVFAHGFHQH
jgi:hypothetical protein